MKLKNFFKNLLVKADGILFNKHLTCNLCGCEIFDGKDFCKSCFKSITFNDNIVCETCGRKVNISTTRCDSCKGEWAVDKARSAFIYTGGAEKLIKDLKYANKQYLAEIIAPYLKEVYVKNFFAPDAITFVPMSEKSELKRGFNQAYLLAKELAKLTDNRLIAPLIKHKDTPQQESLNKKARQENLLKCFKVIDAKAVKDKRILIVDDVLTTGATAHALAQKLKDKGAKSVYLLTVASVVKRI